MPQLDIVSFFIQIISVYFVYGLFFMLVLFKFLPNIALIIKSRKKWLKVILFNRYNVTNNIQNKILNLNTNLLKKGKHFLNICINGLKLLNN